MNKIKRIFSFCVIFMLLIILIFPIELYATTLTSNELIKVNGRTITTTTTIEQINKMFGTPKVETVSAFGGKGYSYYNESYSYYLYIETDLKGVIKAYGALYGNFIARRYAYGDKNDMRYWGLSGTVLSDFDTSSVYGIMEYKCNSSEVKQYWNTYKSDSSTYLYALQKHSIAASKVIAKQNGHNFVQTYSNEEVFYTSELLKENGMNLYDYSNKNGKSDYIKLTSGGTCSFYADLPNPIRFGDMNKNYSKPSDFKYFLYDYDVNAQTLYGLFINPGFLEDKKNVELTSEEKSKLSAAQNIYQKYKTDAEAVKNTYAETPNYSKLPLSAGKMSAEILNAATDYLNLARVGAGMNALKLNSTVADCAQHKATLVYYMSLNKMSTGHYPSKPEGVSDEFYNKAQSYMNENLFMGTPLSSIPYALNDGYGDAITCGHRYNLLNPNYSDWGIGSVGSGISFGWQSAHKFSGYSQYTGDIVAWPSKGITPIDIVGNVGIGNWTARFYNGKYSVTDNTEVTVECLNNGKKYKITKANKNDSGKCLAISGNYMVTFRDDNIVYEDGDVFKITLHNVKNTDGKLVDYTYRTVFVNFYNAENVKTEKINTVSSVELKKGQSKKINIKIEPTNASNKLVKCISNNTNIATIRADGTIIGKSGGTTTVTLQCGGITKNIKVTVDDLPFVDINKSDWFYNSVKYTYNNKIILGLDFSHFGPYSKLTRGMLVTILWRMEGEPVVATNKFSDVKSSDWYYTAVNWAASKGIIHGYSTGKFGPKDNVTREQLCAILMNYAQYKKKNVTSRADISKFKDYKSTSSYFRDAISWCVAKKIISGKENGTKIDPKGSATRAEASAMLTTFCLNTK